MLIKFRMYVDIIVALPDKESVLILFKRQD